MGEISELAGFFVSNLKSGNPRSVFEMPSNAFKGAVSEGLGEAKEVSSFLWVHAESVSKRRSESVRVCLMFHTE